MLQPNDRLDVTLTAAEWNTVMQVLGEGPFRVVQPLIAEIQRQCQAQDQPPLALVPRAEDGAAE
jgi:hypothetical protein